ncbi:MAG: hypothetical protein N2486_01520 [Caloramator sp.]|nr:hypothetical protein [Caloramator sp.]
MEIHKILLPFAFAEILASIFKNIISRDIQEISYKIELILIIFEIAMIVFDIYPKIFRVR